MKYGLFAIRDNVVGEFMTPTVDRDERTAKRNLENAIESAPESLLSTHPSDFGLYRLGTYDTETGCIALNDSGVVDAVLVSLSDLNIAE